ncbi:macro domain-containing protein [Amycolatopsis sp. cmx-11-51]|uniref:macro domain-containing protein n=1 Tax=Amycolatopsis sp. cmx-11-51 TaxID=2785797 RepID=UPI0039E5AB66
MSIARDFTKRRFWTRFATQTLASIGFFAIFAGVTDALFPDLLPPVGKVIAVAVAALSLGFGLYQSWPRPVQMNYSSPNTEIHVVEGDLFEQEGNVVIGMTTTFDTEIPHVIDELGVQAQLLTRIYRNDNRALDDALCAALEDHPVARRFKPEDRKQGKQIAYPLGAVATIMPAVRKLYFCVAYTEMNNRNEARGSVDGIWRSLNNVWDEVRAKGNGDPISIAVIGGGQARISQYFPAQDSIRFIALSYMFASRKEKIASRLNIVVEKRAVRNLDMLELQAFLKSLRPS